MRFKRIPTIDPIMLEFAEDPLRPEKNLLLAILERAIRDAVGLGAGGPPLGIRHFQVRVARAWFGLSDRYAPAASAPEWSFQWLCQNLGISAEKIHGQLQRALIEDCGLGDFRRRVEYLSFRYFDLGAKMKAGGK